MTTEAANLLVGASTDFLRHFSPFNRMEADALAFLAERAVLAFHARGSDILTPEMGVPRHFYIVQRGKVQARQTGSTTVTEYASLNLGPGNAFRSAPSRPAALPQTATLLLKTASASRSPPTTSCT